MSEVRTAIAGLGWWGRKMTDLIQSKGRGLKIIRAADPSAEARDFAAAKNIRLSERFEDILSDPDVEAVILATPHALHGSQIAGAVAAGKHVFCEKPLALTRAEAQKSVDLCRSGHLVLGMGHERRFEPPIADLLRQAEAGRLGRLLQIEANFSHDKFLSLAKNNWRLDPEHAPAAGMTATGIHLTDLAVKLMGPAADVRVICASLASDMAQGDTLSAHVRFAGGASAYISATLATPFFSRFAVFGTNGWIDIRDKAHVEKPEGWIVTRAYKGTAIESFEVPPAEPVIENLEAFAAAVRGTAPYPITGEEMISNIALLEAIVKAAKSGALERVP